MIFVVDYEKADGRYIDMVVDLRDTPELNTDIYEKVNKIFLCVDLNEVQEVTRFIQKEISDEA